MLQALRDKSTGWITIVVLGFLAFLLLLSGLSGYSVSTPDVSAAKVGGEEILPEEFSARYVDARTRFVQSGQDDQSAKVSSLNIETTKEKHLWPLVASWLKTEKDYQYASDTHANVKSNGKWGNPDVVGLNFIEEFGFFNIEIVTVEVKPSLSSWRTWIFEAVSHKRFSERVYFAVRTNDPDGSEISELARYSEKYGIGLLIIDLLDSDYRKLTNWTSISDDIRNLETDKSY